MFNQHVRSKEGCALSLVINRHLVSINRSCILIFRAFLDSRYVAVGSH